MKYIYILYSDILGDAYIGSTSNKLTRRLAFHKNNNNRKKLTCNYILNQKDYKIDMIFSFDDISKTNLEIMETKIIKYYKNKLFCFKNKHYKIINKSLPYVNKRFLCTCGCNKELIKKTILKHLKNINN